MGARGNIVLRHPDGTRTFYYTHWGGREVGRVLADALREKGASDAAALGDAIRARLAEHGNVYVSDSRTWPDFDEYHLDLGRGEVVQVTMDILYGEVIIHMQEREVRRWSVDAFARDLRMMVSSARKPGGKESQ